MKSFFSYLIVFVVAIFFTDCVPPGGEQGGKSDSSGFGVLQIIFFLVFIGPLIFLLWKIRKDFKILAYIFLGLCLISLIISLKFKDWVLQGIIEPSKEGVRETLRKGEPIIFVLTVLFLILGGYFLYKSTSKKE